MNEIPRRCFVDKHVPAEKAIHEAIGAVEVMGADPLLTEAVTLLSQAKDKVSDFVDRIGRCACGQAVLESHAYDKMSGMTLGAEDGTVLECRVFACVACRSLVLKPQDGEAFNLVGKNERGEFENFTA